MPFPMPRQKARVRALGVVVGSVGQRATAVVDLQYAFAELAVADFTLDQRGRAGRTGFETTR